MAGQRRTADTDTSGRVAARTRPGGTGRFDAGMVNGCSLIDKLLGSALRPAWCRHGLREEPTSPAAAKGNCRPQAQHKPKPLLADAKSCAALMLLAASSGRTPGSTPCDRAQHNTAAIKSAQKWRSVGIPADALEEALTRASTPARPCTWCYQTEARGRVGTSLQLCKESLSLFMVVSFTAR
eukprot:66068-Chlamydomonas_euryale.AAC.2